MIALRLGDCLDRLGEVRGVGGVICDPPYDLTAASRGGSPRGEGTGPFGRHTLDTREIKGFMGKTWDGTGIAFDPKLWNLVYDALAPGGILRVFGGTRTFHRLIVAMETAGFVDVHLDAWVYGSGFPKSLNLGKALDKFHGAKREPKRIGYSGNAVLRTGGQNTRPWMEAALEKGYHELPGDEPVTDDAKEWDGWGTAMKPSWEPMVLGRKPLDGA